MSIVNMRYQARHEGQYTGEQGRSLACGDMSLAAGVE